MAFDPKTIAGLNVWLDAAQLPFTTDGPVLVWTDMSGNGNHGNIVSTPYPALRRGRLNGKPTVRFKAREGRLRGNSGLAHGTPTGTNYSIFIVCRMLGPTLGRIFSSDYPLGNLSVGYHSSAEDSLLESPPGWVAAGAAYTYIPTPWKLQNYMSASDGTNIATAYYRDGVYITGHNNMAAQGLQEKYCLSGYGTGTDEACDCEVAELLIYNRRLDDTERGDVQNYLWNKYRLWWQPQFDPLEIQGLNVWLDAASYPFNAGFLTSGWSDRTANAYHAYTTGTGTAPQVVGAVLDNKPVVQYVAAGAYQTGTVGIPGGTPALNFSVFHVGRVRGPGLNGRMFSGNPSNFLLGSHGAGYDACFDNGWLTYTAWGSNTSSLFKSYAYTSTSTDGVSYLGKLYINNTWIADKTTPIGAGLNGYSLNEFTGAGEKGDIDMAEVLIFNRGLAPPEASRINEYLAAKWLNRIPQAATRDMTYAGSLDGGSGWYTNCTIVSNAVTGPDGTMTADKVVPGTSSGGHSIYWAYPHTDNTYITYSVYAQAGGINNFMVYSHDAGDWSSFSLVGAGSSSNGGNATSYITRSRGPWYRCVFTVKKVGNVNPAISNYIIFSGTGNGVDGVYLWGAELVRSRYPSASPWVNAVGAVEGSKSTTAGSGAPTNLITQPYSFDSSLWEKTNLTVVADPHTVEFRPATIEGLSVWLEASHLSYESNNPPSGVTQFRDLSGNGRHCSIAGLPNGTLVSNALNRRAVVRITRPAWFTGSSGLPASGRGSRTFSVFYVARVVGPGLGRVLTAQSTTLSVGYVASAHEIAYDGAWINSPGSTYSTLPTPWRLWGYVASDNGLTYSSSFRRDGGVVATVPSGTGAGMQSVLSLGANGDSADCEIAEVLIYNRALTVVETTLVEDYLRLKWALW